MIRQLIFGIVLGTVPAIAAPPPVSAIAYHPNGKLLAAGTHGDVAVVDSTKGEVVARIGGQTGRVTAIAFSRDGKRLAVASGEPGKSGIFKLYDVVESGPTFEIRNEINWMKDVQYALDFAPDHKTLATAGYDRVIRIWNTDSIAKLDFCPFYQGYAAGARLCSKVSRSRWGILSKASRCVGFAKNHSLHNQRRTEARASANVTLTTTFARCTRHFAGRSA
jgi:hypothetical protein